MATLLQLKQIDANSGEDPVTATGEVLQAIQLKQKVEAALWIRAESYLSGDLPADPQERNEAIGFAQKIVSQSSAVANQVLRLLLGAHQGLTKETILSADDAAISSAVTSVVTLMAKGLHPGR